MDPSKPAIGRSREVAEQIRQEILTGRLQEGARITEAGLSKRFGLGRGPIREAVQRLALQGLLETRPNCGAVVATSASNEVVAVLVPLRRTLECYALKQIFTTLKPEDFEHWDSILQEMKSACENQDFHAIAEKDIAFHRYLMERLDQPDLLGIWDLLTGRMRTHFRKAQRDLHENLMEIYDEHVVLLTSFRSQSMEDAIGMLTEKIN